MTAAAPRASLVIPCYDEAANLPLLIERCRARLGGAPVEVVLVDNGSRDETPRVLAEALAGDPLIRSVRVDVNQGYGFGILAGLRAARGGLLAWTHADMQTDPADLLPALERFDRAPDPDRLFVKGRRSGRPLADVAFTMGMALFETVLLRRRFWDINAQPTVFPRSFFEAWTDPPGDFSLDLFAYYEARRRGLRVERIPVTFGERAHGTSHWNVDWKSKVRFIRRTLDFSFELRARLRAERRAGR